MGAGSWSSVDARDRTSTRVELPVQTVFTARGVHPSMDPRGLVRRESRDSAEHPRSRAVAWFLDVSKSQGPIPHALATRTLPDFADRVLGVLPDAQILFGGIGDAEDGDRAPWQIGQWESSDRLADQWLTRLFLEGGGGPNGEESYDLALYFLARLTSIDCLEKRGERGYAFLTGDERPRSRVSARAVNQLLGRPELAADIPIEQIVAEAAERFHLFYLIPDLRRAEECATRWRELIGEHVICMEDPADASLVGAEIIGLTEGINRGEFRTFLDRIKGEGVPEATAQRVFRSVRQYAMTLGIGDPYRDVSGNRDLPATRPSGIRRLT